MELLQLKYFCHAANTENFSQTARKFGVPPSDISQSIRRLEKELSVSLFIRQSNRISLSHQGQTFYQGISAALALIDDSVDAIAGTPDHPKINICINTNRRIVMQAIEEFKKHWPNVDISAKYFSDPTSDAFDLIIANNDIRLVSYKKQKLLSEELAFAVNCQNQLASSPQLTALQLAEQPFITMNEQSSLFELTNTICTDLGFQPHIAIQCDDPFYIRKCVELNVGISIVPVFSWQGQFSDSIVLRPIHGYTRNTFLYTDPGRHSSPFVKEFIAILMGECAASQGTYISSDKNASVCT